MRRSIITTPLFLIFSPLLLASESGLILRYDKPAADSYQAWQHESLPLGNGSLGASIFGGVTHARIQLNEKSLWSGGPAKQRPDYQGGNLPEQGQNGATLRRIQELYRKGKNKEASALCNRLTGLADDTGTRGYGYYLSYGNMHVHFTGLDGKPVEHYQRSLDLDRAVASVSFQIDGTRYTREHFISHPHQVIVTKFTTEGAAKLNGTLNIDPDTERGSGGGPATEESYGREWVKAGDEKHLLILGELKDNQLRFASSTRLLHEGGSLEYKDGEVHFKDAQQLIVITSIDTDYRNQYPHYRSGQSAEDLLLSVQQNSEKALKLGYDALVKAHLEDYRALFTRVRLVLSNESSINQPLTTDALLQACKQNTATDSQRRQLETLLFQYGRYLLIASSRHEQDENPDQHQLPANLQGIWAAANNSPWHADYHMNVNLQMNYWPAYSTQLSECASPLIDYIHSLREPGRVTAAVYAGIHSTEAKPEQGFISHTQNNPFGWTCPGWSFDWGWSTAALPWILQNCWEAYEYGEDEELLRQKIYPMMREAARYFDQTLTLDAEGKLVSSPAYSPEHGPRTHGNTYEHSLIWQLYEDSIRASTILDTDADLRKLWREKQAALKGPLEIGTEGQIKEWYEEEKLNEWGEGRNHRHISHMLGLYPGDLITADTPEFFKAAHVSMTARTDESTGWAMGQRINSWARLGEGDKAHELISTMLRIGILKNLWATHPPFQIDGNFGLCAGVSEMLLQSHRDNLIELLPALPQAWKEGRVSELMARGRVKVAMRWADGQLVEAQISPHFSRDIQVELPSVMKITLHNVQGEAIPFEQVNPTRIRFKGCAQERYNIKMKL